MYREITRGLQIDVDPFYVPENSTPSDHYYFFAYRVTITNQGEAPAQLLRRHWIITDGTGTRHEVRGDGVVGQQPFLQPGESFEYTSFCPLPTPTGNMRGTYDFQLESGEEFAARIPLFFLRNLGQDSNRDLRNLQ